MSEKNEPDAGKDALEDLEPAAEDLEDVQGGAASDPAQTQRVSPYESRGQRVPEMKADPSRQNNPSQGSP